MIFNYKWPTLVFHYCKVESKGNYRSHHMLITTIPLLGAILEAVHRMHGPAMVSKRTDAQVSNVLKRFIS